MNYVYIIECKDKTLYTGWTTDLERRIQQHNDGVGSKYTRCRVPVELKYSEEHETKANAMKREIQIKKLSRKQKQKLFMKG